MSGQIPPPPLGDKWNIWGERISKYLTATRNTLQHKDSDSVPYENGIILWDDASGSVVVSKNGAWVKLELDP